MDDYQFEVYRLIITETDDLFDEGKEAKSDDDYLDIVRTAAGKDFDALQSTNASAYRFSVRDYRHIDAHFATVRFARSLIEQRGQIVTDETIIEGTSNPDPPTGIVINILFYMSRHLVAVEHNGTIMSSGRWRTMLHEILDKAAISAGYRSKLRLEPYPRDAEVLRAFNGFSRLTRLRVHLQLPNPELSRFSKRLRDEMLAGGVRDYLQDMRNPEGLNQKEGELPHATAAMAEQGYKDGMVILEGIRDGRAERVVTGEHAARGTVEKIRDFIRGMNIMAQTKEAKSALASIVAEIDRVAPPPQKNKNGN